MSFSWLPRLLAVVGLAAAAGGCVKDDVSLSITRFIPPDTSGTGCVYDVTVMDSLARGTYDTTVAKYFGGVGYTVAFVVQNNLLELMSAPIETQSYDVTSYNVTLELSGVALTAALSGTQTAFNYQNASIHLTPGSTGVGFAQLISPTVAPKLFGVSSGTITAHIQAVASKDGTQEVGTDAIFPVDLCAGCLIGTTVLPACPLTVSAPAAGNPCNPAADEPVTCCEPTTGGEPLCGKAVAPAM